MHFLKPTSAALLLLWAPAIVAAASSWSFTDATINVQAKGAGVGGGQKEKLVPNKPLSKPIDFGATDTLKIALTAQDGKSAKRPHQAFLSIVDSTTGLETSFALAVKESGKGKLELTHKDIPTQLLVSTKPLTASLVVASFGSSTPYNSKSFDLNIKADASGARPTVEKPLRYGKLPEIHHIFRADAKSPPKIISLFFTVVVLGALPALFIGWLGLGANINHLQKALGNSPVSHALFFGSIVSMEGIFFLYYTTWNLFQILPAAAIIGTVIFLSGTRALTEVQERRLAGLR